MRKIWLAFVAAAVLAVWSSPAKAVVLYDNGGPDYVDAYFSDTQNLRPIFGDLVQSYNDFSLTSAASITGIEFWGEYFNDTPPAADGFDYTITSRTDSSQPGAALATGSLSSIVRTDTGLDLYPLVPGGEIYQYTASLPGVSLGAGDYYLSIFGTVSNPNNPFLWATSSDPDAAGDVWLYDATFSSWTGPVGVELAYNLTGEPVPEPATITLLGLGLAGLIGRRMRRSRGK